MAKAKDQPLNSGLSAAKAAKQDEFYTQYVDIQKEVAAYLEFDPATFRDQIVYCNCDDPFESNFFKYFAANFNQLGLKKLITTSYDGSPIAGAQLPLFEYDAGQRQRPQAIAVEIDSVTDINGDGATGIEVAELMFRLNREHGTTLVLVTHDTALAARCPRRIALAAGRLVGDAGTAPPPVAP